MRGREEVQRVRQDLPAESLSPGVSHEGASLVVWDPQKPSLEADGVHPGHFQDSVQNSARATEALRSHRTFPGDTEDLPTRFWDASEPRGETRGARPCLRGE